MKIQEGSSATHFELAANSKPVTLTPGKGFQTQSLLSSSAAPKGCIGAIVDWVKSLFQKIWNLLTCQSSSSKTKETTEVENEDAEEEIPEVPAIVGEKLTQWLSRYYPNIGKLWENMSFKEQQNLFGQVLNKGLPIESLEEESQTYEWLQLAYKFYVGKQGAEVIKSVLKHEIIVSKEQPIKYEKESSQSLAEIMKENENYQANFFTQNSAGSNAQFQVGPSMLNGERYVRTETNRFFFCNNAYSLCASFACALSAETGKLFTIYDIQKKVADKYPNVNAQNSGIDVYADQRLFDILGEIAPIKIFQYMGVTEDKKFKTHEFSKKGEIFLVCYNNDNIDSITHEKCYFLPLIRVN